MHRMTVLILTIFSTLLFGEVQGGAERFELITKEAACQGYEKDFIELVEMVYGEGFLSQGGEHSIGHMVDGLDLDGATILDVGSGIGGPCIYLAKNHRVHVVGVDPQEWMVHQAREALAKDRGALKGTVDFVPMESTSNLRQFHDASFDVLLSKETLLHIPKEVKGAFFAEMFRVLKPGGHLVIDDWLSSDIPFSENTKKMVELDGVAYNCILLEEYQNLLEEVGFSAIRWEDTSKDHSIFSQENLNTIASLEEEIKTRYDAEVFHESLNSWQWQKEAFDRGEIKTGIFRAKKL